MRESPELGSLVAPSDRKNDTRITRLSGTITFCSSSIRETSDPATAKSDA